MGLEKKRSGLPHPLYAWAKAMHLYQSTVMHFCGRSNVLLLALRVLIHWRAAIMSTGSALQFPSATTKGQFKVVVGS